MQPLRTIWHQLQQPFILVRDRHGKHYLVDCDVDAGLFRAWAGEVYTMLDASREVEHIPCTLHELWKMLHVPSAMRKELREALTRHTRKRDGGAP